MSDELSEIPNEKLLQLLRLADWDEAIELLVRLRAAERSLGQFEGSERERILPTPEAKQ